MDTLRTNLLDSDGAPALSTSSQEQVTLAKAEGASIPASVFTLANTIIGSGVLTLPYAFANTGYIPGMILLLLVAVMSSIPHDVLSRASDVLGVYSYKEICEVAFGRSWAWVCEVACALYPFMTLTGYFVFMGDFLPKVFEVLWSDASVLTTRWSSVAVTIVLVVLPLSLLKELRALRYVSLFSLWLVAYTLAVVMKYQFEDKEGRNDANSDTVLADGSIELFNATPLMSAAFCAHYNSLKVYKEMREKRSRHIMGVTVAWSGLVALVFYTTFGVFGYMAFGKDVKGNVLNSLQVHDDWAVMARLALTLSLSFSYPIVLNAVRGNVFRLIVIPFIYKRHHDPLEEERPNTLVEDDVLSINAVDGTDEADGVPTQAPSEEANILDAVPLSHRVIVTVLIILVTFGISIAIPKVQVVLGYSGSLFGTAIIYIIPGLIGIRLFSSDANDHLIRKHGDDTNDVHQHSDMEVGGAGDGLDVDGSGGDKKYADVGDNERGHGTHVLHPITVQRQNLYYWSSVVIGIVFMVLGVFVVTKNQIEGKDD